MISLTDEENKSYEKQKHLVLMMIIKSIIKSEIIVIILKNIEELLMIFVI